MGRKQLMHECCSQLRLMIRQQERRRSTISRRLLAGLLLLLLLCSNVQAAPLPALDSFADLFSSNSNYQLDLQVELMSSPDLDDLSLQALQQLAENISLQLNLAEGQHSQARLQVSGKPILAVESRQAGDQQVLALEVPGSLDAVSYVSAAPSSPGQMLKIWDARLPSLKTAKQTLDALAQAALPPLMGYEQAIKAATPAKHVGQGASQLVYPLKKEDALAFWQQAAPSLKPLLWQLYSALGLSQDTSFKGFLDTCKPAGALTIKRILDREGTDLGLQITGRLDINGQIRQLTFFGGWSAAGLYLSLKLPAARGSDNLEFQLALTREPEALKGDWRLKTAAGKEHLNASGSIALIAAQKSGRMTLTGNLKAELRFRGAFTSVQTFSFKPLLALEGKQLSGYVHLVRQVEGEPALDLALQVSGQPLTGIKAIETLSTIDLDTLTPAQLTLEQARLNQALVPALHSWIQGLPEQTQQLLLHDLGRDRRARDGRTVEALPGQPHPFTVESQPQNSPTKEDAP